MIEWLFPPRCPVCFEPVLPKGAQIHPACSAKLLFIGEPICKKCGKPLEDESEEYCAECMVSERGWEMGRSVFPYQSIIRRAIRVVKNEGTMEFVRFFGTQLYLHQKKYLYRIKADCIVPIPMHPTKFRRRGFNQAELLAEELGRHMGIPVKCLLKKLKKTKDQKHLTKVQRRKNVRDVYQPDQTLLREGVPQTVLLVDDIVTTGSTLTACAEALKLAGVRKVYFLTVCAGE